MNPVYFALSVFAVVFAGGALGLILQGRIPEVCTTGGPRDMIGAVAGLLTLLSALVLGLLIWTAYGVYASQKVAVQSLAASALQLDLALKDYGPETAPGRQEIKKRVAETVDQIWGSQETDMKFVAQSFSAAIDVFRNANAYLDTLHASTDQQKQAQGAARHLIDSIGQTRLQMAFALTDPISYPLVFIVVSWAVCLFCAYGLMSRHHLMSLVAVGVGAVAVGSAIYLIVDLSDPYTGVFRVSAAPIRQVLAYMDEHP
jgi:hypothetical protein